MLGWQCEVSELKHLLVDMPGRAWAYVLVVYGGRSYSRDIAHPCPSVAEEKPTMVVVAVQGAPIKSFCEFTGSWRREFRAGF